MRNQNTLFTGPCLSFSMCPVEHRLFGDTKRSLGVRAACCRFPFRKLACESPNHRLNLRASNLACFSQQAGENLASLRVHRSRSISSQRTGWENTISDQPASWLEAKAAASCTHSEALLRMPAMGNPHLHQRGSRELRAKTDPVDTNYVMRHRCNNVEGY